MVTVVQLACFVTLPPHVEQENLLCWRNWNLWQHVHTAGHVIQLDSTVLLYRQRNFSAMYTCLLVM